MSNFLLKNLILTDNSALTFNMKNVTKLVFALLDAYPSSVTILNECHEIWENLGASWTIDWLYFFLHVLVPK